MRPLNNIVDITNYVLLEMGHPLHAFDFERLRGGRIVVARAADGQAMRTLDGVSRELDAQMLLINDGAGPVAIAGVMGGLESEILDSHPNHPDRMRVLPARLRAPHLEEARACPPRQAIGSNGAPTGTTPSRRPRGRAASCRNSPAARIAGGLKDVYPRRIEPVQIHLERSRAERLLGVSLTDAGIEQTLSRLQFELDAGRERRLGGDVPQLSGRHGARSRSDRGNRPILRLPEHPDDRAAEQKRRSPVSGLCVAERRAAAAARPGLLRGGQPELRGSRGRASIPARGRVRVWKSATRLRKTRATCGQT